MGLDNLFDLTQKKSYKLRINMETFAGARKTARYATFKLTENVNRYSSTPVSGVKISRQTWYLEI